MDARTIKIGFVLISLAISVTRISGADYTTENFSVRASDAQFAKQVALAAEKYRRELAIMWLGHELKPWSEKCPITVRIEPAAGGQTSFGFIAGQSHSMPTGWKMEVYGSPERILDSVLPHEVTHTIFATHFGRPLPRWADEGACTTVEHASERSKNHQLLIRFLNTQRGIPFNQMFSMKQYPSDIYPLYAQGYSVAQYLIMQGGHQRFVQFVGEGMAREAPNAIPRAWDAVINKYYGFKDLSDLQVSWVDWVRKGCPEIEPTQLGQSDAPGAPNTHRSSGVGVASESRRRDRCRGRHRRLQHQLVSQPGISRPVDIRRFRIQLASIARYPAGKVFACLKRSCDVEVDTSAGVSTGIDSTEFADLRIDCVGSLHWHQQHVQTKLDSHSRSSDDRRIAKPATNGLAIMLWLGFNVLSYSLCLRVSVRESIRPPGESPSIRSVDVTSFPGSQPDVGISDGDAT